MGKGQSEWVSATLGDLSGLSEFLDDLQGVVDGANSGIDALVGVLNTIITIVDVLKNIVTGIEDVQKIAIEAALRILEEIKDAIVELLENIFDFGLYVLPHFEAFDFGKVIRNEILSPGFEGTSLASVDRFIRVPDKDDPSSSHFERVRRRGRVPATDYNQFVQDIDESFDDIADVLRPLFDANTKLSSVIIGIASDRIAIFLVAYLLLSMFWGGGEGSKGVRQNLAKAITIVLGESETLGRFQNEPGKDELTRLRDAIVDSLKEEGESFGDLISRFLDIFDIDSEEINTDDPEFVSIKVSGDTDNFVIIPDGTGIGNVPEDKQNGINFTNLAELEVTTNGAGRLYVSYFFDEGESITAIAGQSNKKYNIGVPLTAAGFATSNFILNGTLNWPPNLKYDFENNTLFNIEGVTGDRELGSPTKISLTLVKIDENGEDLVDLASEVNPDQSLFVQTSLALPKMERLTDNDKQSFRDAYRHNIEFEIDFPDSATKRRVSEYLGISISELEKRFPLRTRSRGIDLTQFGPELTRANIKVGVRPQVSINNTFEGQLIVNGNLIEPDDVKIFTSTAEFTFENVDLGDAADVVLMFVSQQEQDVFVSANSSDNGTYIAYSEPEVFSFRKQGGRLGAPIITSGTRVNVTENVFKFKPGDGGFIGEGVTGITGGPGKNRFNNLYDRGKGSNDTQDEIVNAIYRITGKKSKDAIAYAVIKGPDGERMEVLGNNFFGEKPRVVNLNTPIVGGIGFGSNRFSKELILSWNKKDTRYRIRVYQTNDKNKIDLLTSSDRPKTEAEFLSNKKGGSHDSEFAEVEVHVTNKNTSLEATPPNWVTVSLGSFFPILDGIDERLSELIDIIRESVPAGPYDGIRDWLDVMKDKIDNLVEIFEKIRDIINNINSILQIGGTGFWFLGIDGANGVPGFRERLKKVQVPQELADAKNVTGMVLMVPSKFPGSEVPAGSTLMDTVFAKLPSEGTDSVQPPDQRKTFKGKMQSLIDENKNDFRTEVGTKLQDIKTSRKKIRELGRDDIRNISFRAEDLD